MTASPSSTSDPKLKVVNMVDVPRGGWRYLVTATNTVIQAGSILELKARVKQHMVANRVEFPKGLDIEIEDCACRNLENHAYHWCRERNPETEPVVRERPRWRAVEIARFLKTIWDWGTTSGFAFVSQEEAERRAAICARCPMNTQVSGCLGCTGVARLINRIRRDRTTSFDNDLDACNVCGCELKVKVLVPLDVIDNSGLDYPDWCWNNQTKEKP